MAASVAPLLLGVQLITYLKFFYSRRATVTIECLVNFLVCLVLDFMILWSHSMARKDPGFLKAKREIKERIINFTKDDDSCE